MYRLLFILLVLTARQAAALDLVAHRGYGCGASQNSIASVKNAWRAGADGVELDVRVSTDGVVYLFHDNKIGKTKISNLPFPKIIAISAEAIPTLQELLNSVQSAGYYVFDLKDDDLERVDEVLRIVRNSHLELESVFFQSGSLEVLTHIRRYLPTVKLTYLTHLKWRIPYLIRPSANWLVRVLEGSQIDRVSMKGRSFIDRAFVDIVKASGREVHVWTINNRRRAAYYQKIGVDGLVTDRATDLFGEQKTNKTIECSMSVSGAA